MTGLQLASSGQAGTPPESRPRHYSNFTAGGDLTQARGVTFHYRHHGGSGPDRRGLLPLGLRVRNFYDPDGHIDEIKVMTRIFDRLTKSKAAPALFLGFQL